MKKKLIGTITCFLLMLSFSLVAFGANKVNSIEVEAVIYKDGSMYITQTWDGSFDEGTENYIPINAPDYLTISGLTVNDKNGTYETLENWDVDKSFEEKANKCGINYTDNGYEICFGISEYGENRYAIEYKLDNVVGGYTDMDGVNFRFVNDKMNTTPTDVTVKINLADGTPITDEIADVWGFGFEGKVGFENGAIIAFTESSLNYENHVTVMFDFNKGILSPARAVNNSIEAAKQAAFDGSDYNYDNGEDVPGFQVFLLLAATFLIPTAIIIFVMKLKKKKKQKALEKFSDKHGYFREIPNEGNTNATYELGRLFEMCEDGAILATGMLKLIELGCIEPISNEEVGFMGRTREVVNLKLMGSNHSVMGEYDEYLYTVLEGAAGHDSVLQAKELERFSQQHDTLLRNYINKCEQSGKAYLNKKRCLKSWDIPSELRYLTPSGEKEFGEMMGFKKYLEDFSLIAERGVKEMAIWKEMLSYAMLFGIADRVSEQMKQLYPSISVEVESYSQTIYTAFSYQGLMYRNMRNAEERREQEMRSSGSGGQSSIGGGGGSIGGGSGGGGR